MKFGYNQPSSFEIVDGRTDRRPDERTTKLAYTLSSPGAFSSGELTNKC